MATTPDDDQLAQLHSELVRELAPVGVLENILVAELARRAVNLDRWSDAASAVRDTAANLLADFDLAGKASFQPTSTVLAAAASCDAVARAERISSAQGRAFYRALQMLLQLQQRRKAVGGTAVAAPASNLFPTEAACLNYLVEWQREKYQCRACGARCARLVPSRSCLECAACGAQSGVRGGTVLADSPLPLVTWFAGIRVVLDNPGIGTTELKRYLGLSRAATARGMALKIRTALAAENRTALLAGLDRYFWPPESSVPSLKKSETPKIAFRSQLACIQIVSEQSSLPN